MTVAVALALYVGVLAAAGPWLLARVSAGATAPRLAIAAWLTAAVTMLGCTVAVASLLLVEAAGHGDGRDALVASCLKILMAMLAGREGSVTQIVAATVAAVAVGLAAAFLGRLCAALRRIRTHTDAHADAARLVGRSRGGGVVVLDASEPAAYCVAGRPPVIVVTTAALSALDGAELDAVLAHERAHLDGRHAHLVAVMRGLAAALPGVALFSRAAHHIDALLEMCADDVAARRHGPDALLAGLLALAGARTPRRSLAAAGVAVLTRARRLSDPPPALARMRAGVALGGAVATMAAPPFVIAALAVSGALVCFL